MMLSAINAHLREPLEAIESDARWLDEYCRQVPDVNHPVQNARRALWAAVRNVRTARAELERIEG